MEYSFNVEHAKEYGVNEAIMIKNFQFWLSKNKSNGKHLIENRTWTYNSVKAFAQIFPFWTPRQINKTLNKLVDKKVLIRDNHNTLKYDRTMWYAFADEQTFLKNVKSILPKSKKEVTKKKNATTQKVKAIPNTKTTNDNTLYKDMISIYDTFCLKMFDAPAKINGVEGKAMKQIITYLKTLCKAKGDSTDDAVKYSLTYILNSWHTLEPFYQKQIKLTQINSNLTNIINQIKNGTEKRNSSSIADEILAKYQ